MLFPVFKHLFTYMARRLKMPMVAFCCAILTDNIRFIVSSASAIWQEGPSEFLCESVTKKLPSDS